MFRSELGSGRCVLHAGVRGGAVLVSQVPLVALLVPTSGVSGLGSLVGLGGSLPLLELVEEPPSFLHDLAAERFVRDNILKDKRSLK